MFINKLQLFFYFFLTQLLYSIIIIIMNLPARNFIKRILMITHSRIVSLYFFRKGKWLGSLHRRKYYETWKYHYAQITLSKRI